MKQNLRPLLRGNSERYSGAVDSQFHPVQIPAKRDFKFFKCLILTNAISYVEVQILEKETILETVR
ncbi:MAG: hypothetical protein ACK44B_09175, partial [Flavobacteriales bacterium]